MNKRFGFALCGAAGLFLVGCGQPSQPANLTPTGTTPTGVVAAPSETPVATVLEKAGKGSGKQGRLLDKREGIYVTPVKALFSAKEFITYEISVKSALNYYKAEEGHAPKTHEEFMEKIVKDNNIKLPVLPEGHKYVYDPMTETLMVEKPAP